MALSGASGGYDGVENGATSLTGPSVATGSVTPTINNCVVITGFVGDDLGSGNAPTIANAFNLAQATLSFVAIGEAYKVQTTLASENPTWTNGASGTSHMAAAIAVFKKT